MTFKQAKKTIQVKSALLELLRQTRPSGDIRTYNFFDTYLKRYIQTYEIIRDQNNNFIVIVPHKNGDMPKHAFTSHYDTVHRNFTDNAIYIDDSGIIFTDQSKAGTPLGADDASGIFAMIELIKSDIAGCYLFFSDEEIGGVGSNNFNLDMLPCELEIMISLDRANYNDVVIMQSFEKGASEQFGQWIADSLNSLDNSFNYQLSYDGVFTDSANFHGIIPECINLSIGYFKQHTKYETLDYSFLCSLIDALKQIDFNSAPVIGVSKKQSLEYWNNDNYWNSIPVCSDSDLVDYVFNNPEKVASFLESIGANVIEIEECFTLNSNLDF